MILPDCTRRGSARWESVPREASLRTLLHSAKPCVDGVPRKLILYIP